MIQLVYFFFISNNTAAFHLWRNKNLLNYWKDSKYYEKDCLQNFILLSMFLLTTKFRLEHSLSFWKYVVKLSWNYFNTKFTAQWKDWKINYKVSEILKLFCYFTPLVLAWKVLELQKMSNNSSLKGSSAS